MSSTMPERPTLVQGETRLFSVSFDGRLDSGESLTGTPLVAEQTTSNLTIANKTVSTSALTIKGKSVAAGKAVQFKVSGQLAATNTYTIKITCGTNSDPAQTLIQYVKFDTVS